jgi:CDP-diglyceride synthetase
MLSIGFILAFIGAAVALLIGILIFSEVSTAIDCPTTTAANPTGRGATECNDAKDTAWTVIGILPVALFFALFAIFGAIGGRQ